MKITTAVVSVSGDSHDDISDVLCDALMIILSGSNKIGEQVELLKASLARSLLLLSEEPAVVVFYSPTNYATYVNGVEVLTAPDSISHFVKGLVEDELVRKDDDFLPFCRDTSTVTVLRAGDVISIRLSGKNKGRTIKSREVSWDIQ